MLSKILDFAISPLTWVIGLLLWAIFDKNRIRKKRLLISATIVLLLFTNPFVFNTVMGWYEWPAVKAESLMPAEAGIMLGGTIKYFNSSQQRPSYGQAVDRFMQVIDLYNKKRIKKIIIASGSGSLVYTQIKEGDLLRQQLIDIGLDSNNVLAESDSRNTRENAIYTAALIKSQKLTGPFVLVTSAFHMRRSVLCFKKAGLEVIPFPVDQHSGKGALTPDRLFIPNTEVLFYWNLLFHEWAGLVTYKIAGYI